MRDRVLGVFVNAEEAVRARELLLDGGYSADQMRVERVLEQSHRGLGDPDTVHSLLHAPRLEESNHVSEDAGTVILVVDATDDSDTKAIESDLDEVGATTTGIVPATPGLDL